jgi:hypothetical protein
MRNIWPFFGAFEFFVQKNCWQFFQPLMKCLEAIEINDNTFQRHFYPGPFFQNQSVGVGMTF